MEPHDPTYTWQAGQGRAMTCLPVRSCRVLDRERSSHAGCANRGPFLFPAATAGMAAGLAWPLCHARCMACHSRRTQQSRHLRTVIEQPSRAHVSDWWFSCCRCSRTRPSVSVHLQKSGQGDGARLTHCCGGHARARLHTRTQVMRTHAHSPWSAASL